MSKFEYKKVMPRYSLFVILMALVALAAVGKAGYIMTAEKDYWQDVADRVKRDSVEIKPVRGNIYSCDGDLLASSIPEFKLLVDFKAMHISKADTLWATRQDSICEGLSYIFSDKTAEEFKVMLNAAKDTLSTRCVLCPSRVSYSTYTAVKALPIFKLDKNTGGFYTEEYNSRVRPNGSLAQRTIGEMFGSKDSARCGLELAFDDLLRGQVGYKHRRKIRNKYLDIIDQPAVDGADLYTTIDIQIQDLAERALIKELKDSTVNGEMGVAIVMEVATGDVKAIVNMTKCADGEYHEIVNHAINYRCEPGSVFKPASIMVALDDDELKLDTGFVIHTGSGIMQMHGRPMKDWNWYKGGYQDINIARSLEVSSNVGVSYVVDHFYHEHPEKFVQGLYNIGINEDLQLPIKGYNKPTIVMPEYNSKGKWTNWDHTRLPWMSIGYCTMIAPINTLTFYNAIANNGRMVRPRFVTKAMKDGVVVKEFPVEVIKEQICKPSTLKTMQTILHHVVTQGLGNKAKPHNVEVSGKTGTAQVSQGAAGYKSGKTGYWLSFAGYFPSEAPKYSCIVCIKKTGMPASGGGMSGVVFNEIAAGIQARDKEVKVSTSRDEYSVAAPEVNRGNMAATGYLLNELGVSYNGVGNSDPAAQPIWGSGTASNNSVSMHAEAQAPNNVMPDVTGMGARDAVYLLENRGLKVTIVGRGKVVSQSLEPGRVIQKGEECTVTLEV